MTAEVFEVELKYRVADAESVSLRLADQGVDFGEPIVQIDRYFAHPSRDFGKTDEALRIRTIGERVLITYKGPKIDAETKTRKEIELQVGEGEETYTKMVAFFESLGFQTVATVRKSRRSGQLDHADRTIEVVLDHVDDLGDFIELELVSSESLLNEDRDRVLSAAAKLGLTDAIRTSYLQLLLDSRGSSGHA